MIKNIIKSLSTHTLLIVFSLAALLPFVWLLSTALKGSGENIFQYPPVLMPQDFTLDNFKEVLKVVPIIKYALNSFIVAAFIVILNLIFCSLAAYPLARMEFLGKKVMFFVILSTIMVPFQAIMLPIYMIVLKLNLVDSAGLVQGYLGMILPFAVNAFGIFLLRQAYLGIPKELEQSAFIDGCNVFQIFYKVHLPIIKPSLAILAIFTFVGSWGEFLWPSIILTNDSLFTLPVGINNLQGAFSANYRLIAAGAIISIIPIVVFFLALQKYFVSGQNDGAVKG